MEFLNYFSHFFSQFIFNMPRWNGFLFLCAIPSSKAVQTLRNERATELSSIAGDAVTGLEIELESCAMK